MTSTLSKTSLIIPTNPRNEVDKILSSMQKQERKRTATSVLSTVWSLEAANFKARKRSIDTLSRTDTLKNAAVDSTACTNCHETDTSKFSLTTDKSELSCSSCGACFRKANPISNTYEATTRSEMTKNDQNTSSLADGIDDARGRSAMRILELETTTVKGALKNAQLSIQRTAVSEEREHMTRAQSSKRDRVIVEIHRNVRLAGRDPDRCAICADATALCNNVFVRCAMHASRCSNTDNCKFGVINASKSALAMQSICYSIDNALQNSESSTCVVLGGVPSVQRIASEMSVVLKNYREQRSVSEYVSKRVEFVIKAPHAIVYTACANEVVRAPEPPPPPPPAEDEGGGGEAGEDDDDDDANEPSRTVDIDMQRLHLSIQSIASLGWVEYSIVDMAMAYAMSPEFHEWMRPLRGWPTDILAMMIVSSFSGTSKTNKHFLKQLAKKFAIDFQTVQEKLQMLSTCTAESSN